MSIVLSIVLVLLIIGLVVGVVLLIKSLKPECIAGQHSDCGDDKYCNIALKCVPRLPEGSDCNTAGDHRRCVEGLWCGGVPIKCRKKGQEGETCQSLIHDSCLGELECNVAGKCQRPMSEGPKSVGATCAVGADCAGFGAGPVIAGTDCCRSVCTQKVKDWAGYWYCPHECKGTSSSGPGTCATSKPMTQEEKQVTLDSLAEMQRVLDGF